MKTAWLVFLIFLLLFGYVFEYVHFSNVQKEFFLERDSLLNTISAQEADVSKKNDTMLEYKKTIESLSLSIDAETNLNKSFREENKKLKNEISDLKDKVVCENQISWDVDYSNAGTVHKSLIRWIEEVESVEYSSYKTLYNNSKTSWHEIHGIEYWYFYVVFYDEPDFEKKNAIYSVGCQAYVD